MNTVNYFISNLVGGPQPAKDPGMTAWTWFQASDTVQPPQVNEFVRPLLVKDMNTIAIPPSYGPDTNNNWATWSGTLNTNLPTAPPGSDVRKWLEKEYPADRLDPPTVPEDVINWTKSVLPSGITVVVRKGQGVKGSY